jgi:hypothetical protein
VFRSLITTDTAGNETPTTIVAELPFCERFTFLPELLLESAPQHFTENESVLSSQLKIHPLDRSFSKAIIVGLEYDFFDSVKKEIQAKDERGFNLLSHIDL